MKVIPERDRKPVLIYSQDKQQLIPSIHVWIDKKAKRESYIDIAELPLRHPFMKKFRSVYPHAFELFKADRQSMIQWLYDHYNKIVWMETAVVSKAQKRKKYRELFLTNK